MTYSTTWNVKSSFGTAPDYDPEAREQAAHARMPDIYADRPANDETQPDVQEQSSAEIDRSIGFNPYDTGVLQYKKPQG